MSAPDSKYPSHPGVREGKEDLYKRASNGLANLQLHSTTRINKSTMDVVVETLWRRLPLSVRPNVYCAPAYGPDLWSNVPEKHEAAIDHLRGLSTGKIDGGNDFRVFLKRISTAVHVIWPLWVEDEFGAHWVVLYWNTALKRMTQGWFSYIQEIRLFDPALDYGYHTSGHQENFKRRERITYAFANFLSFFRPIWAIGDFGSLRWIPTAKGQKSENGLMHGFHASFKMDEGDHATGERCYSLIKQLLAGVVEAETARPIDYYEPHREHLGKLTHVDPYLARMEMAGICAWQSMEAKGFKARVTVADLPDALQTKFSALTHEGKKCYVKPEDLKSPERQYDVVTQMKLHRAKEERLLAAQEELERQGGPPGPEGMNNKHRTSCSFLNAAATTRAQLWMEMFQADLPIVTDVKRKRSALSPQEGQVAAKKAKIGDLLGGRSVQ
ncbi:hypothetical protein PG993_015189 [Apiospora rasikravindrae]|uniref:Ubiquitin-like protease family profile domain-containing protein n=1 Tax=Apiospora rasikravindrae TaxID=990691 RepID=A0ABR1RRB9_9PEZI